MNLTTPLSVQKLQTTLRAKAKESPKLRFHALYDKVYRRDVLTHAYERCWLSAAARFLIQTTAQRDEDAAAIDWRDSWLFCEIFQASDGPNLRVSCFCRLVFRCGYF
jgi:RNA-directed DNA polymerase